MKSRALRRHHYYRLRKARKTYYGYDTIDRAIPVEYEGYRVSTCPDCSCACCGNPRRHFKYTTRKEKLFALSYIEQCEEANVYCTLTRAHIKFMDW